METIEYKSTDEWPKQVKINIASYADAKAGATGYGLSAENSEEEVLYEYGGVVETENYKEALFRAIGDSIVKAKEGGAIHLLIQVPCTDTIRQWVGHKPVETKLARQIKAEAASLSDEFLTIMLEKIGKNSNLSTLELARIAIEEGESL